MIFLILMAVGLIMGNPLLASAAVVIMLVFGNSSFFLGVAPLSLAWVYGSGACGAGLRTMGSSHRFVAAVFALAFIVSGFWLLGALWGIATWLTGTFEHI